MLSWLTLLGHCRHPGPFPLPAGCACPGIGTPGATVSPTQVNQRVSSPKSQSRHSGAFWSLVFSTQESPLTCHATLAVPWDPWLYTYSSSSLWVNPTSSPAQDQSICLYVSLAGLLPWMGWYKSRATASGKHLSHHSNGHDFPVSGALHPYFAPAPSPPKPHPSILSLASSCHPLPKLPSSPLFPVLSLFHQMPKVHLIVPPL